MFGRRPEPPFDAGAMDMDRPIVASFSVGSAELYEWMHLNEQVVMRRTETTNNPANTFCSRG